MQLVFPQDYIVWDLETSGLSPENNHILEVAVAIVRGGNVVEEWSEILNYGIDVDPVVSNIHGITKEMCEEKGKDPLAVLTRLLMNINDSRAHVTHNGARFDLDFLLKALNDLGIDVDRAALSLFHIDTAGLYKASMMGEAKGWREDWDEFFKRVLNARVPGLKYNVGVCCDELGISREGVVQHRALADVLLTNAIYQKLVD